MKQKGFSLIELMVVIAIIAVLATVAMPAYRTYLNKAKLNMANAFILNQVDASIRYYNNHGVFGNVEQIGLPFDSGNHESTPQPTGPEDYIAGTIAQITISDSSGSPCPWGSASAYVSNFGAGDALQDSGADLVNIQYMFIDLDGIIVKRCMYTYYQGGISGTELSGNFISDCVNITDQSGIEATNMALVNSCT